MDSISATDLRCNDLDAEDFVPFAAELPVTLEDGSADGVRAVLAIFRDAAGNEAAPVVATILLDRSPPGPVDAPCGAGRSTGVCVNDGAATTNSVSASLALAATGATAVQIATDGCADTEVLAPFAPLMLGLLPPGDGTKSVAVRFADDAGNVTPAFVDCATTPGLVDTIVLDTVAPAPTLAVTLASSRAGDAAGFTTTSSVRVTLAFSPGAGEETSVKHGEGSVDCATPGGYVPLPSTSPLVLGDGSAAGGPPLPLSPGDGLKTWVACFRDAAGNVSSTTGSIVVDTAPPPPPLGTPLCSSCERAATKPSPLTANEPFLAFTNSADAIQLDVDVAADDIDFALTVSSTAPPGLVVAPDRTCANDDQCAGFGETCALFPIEVASPGRAPNTGRRCVVATPFPDDVFAAVPVDATDPTPAPVNGPFTVFTALVDAAGNVSDARRTPIVRDGRTPTVHFALSVAGPTNQTTIDVRDLTVDGETAVDPVERLGTFQVSSLATFADAVTLDFVPAPGTSVLAADIPVALGSGDGPRTVRVRFVDNAGNVAADAEASVEVDTTPPTRPVFATPSSVIGSTVAALTLLARSTDGQSGLRPIFPYDLALPPGVDCEDLDGIANELRAFGDRCGWTGEAFTLKVNALLQDGEKRIFVRAVDAANNVSDGDVVTLVLDTAPPTRPCLERGCAPASPRFTPTTTVTLDIGAPADDEHLAAHQSCVDNEATCDCAFADVPATVFTTTVASGGRSFVCIRAIDEAGNASEADAVEFVHDATAPAAPIFTRPLAEVTGTTTTLLFAAGSTSHDDPNFSHFVVIGGGHLQGERFCLVASAPFCAVADAGRFFLDPATTLPRPVALVVDVAPEQTNTFQVKAVDKAGNESGVTQVTLVEGSLVTARTLTSAANEGQLVAFGDRVAFTVDDRNLDVADTGVLLDPGTDLRFGTADDQLVTLSTTVQVMNVPGNEPGAGVDKFARQSVAIAGSALGVAWIDSAANSATLAGSLRLRTPGLNTVFDGDDVTLALSPFAAGCGLQQGFRHPSMSGSRLAVSCLASTTDSDVYLVTPGANGVYEATGTVGRDDTFVPLANTTDPEHLPTLSHASVTWWTEKIGSPDVVPADPLATRLFDLHIRQPGNDGVLGNGDDTAQTITKGVPNELAVAVGLYLPGDRTIPACQQGVLFVDANGDLLFQSPGDDLVFDGSDTPLLLESGVGNLLGGIAGGAPGSLGKLQLGPGVMLYKLGAIDSAVVRTPGPDRCYNSPDDDVIISDLTTAGSRDIAVGAMGWFEFRTPGIAENALVFHDLVTRQALSDGAKEPFAALALGDGFLLAITTGRGRLIDFDRQQVRAATDPRFVRSIRAGSRVVASSNEADDSLTLFDPGPDDALFGGTDDTAVAVAADATGDAVRDDVIDSQRNFAASDDVVVWFSGADTSNAPVTVNLRFAGPDGVFADGAGGDDCEKTLTDADGSSTSLARDRSSLTADGTRFAWVDTDTSLSSGALQVYESNDPANPCGPGVVTTLTAPASTVPRVRAPVLAGDRLVALTTDGNGQATGVSLFQAPAGRRFRDGVAAATVCTLPTAWQAAVDNFTLANGLTLLEGYAVFVVVDPAGLRKTLACDLGNGTLHLLDTRQPGPVAIDGRGRRLGVLSAFDGSVFQYLFDR